MLAAALEAEVAAYVDAWPLRSTARPSPSPRNGAGNGVTTVSAMDVRQRAESFTADHELQDWRILLVKGTGRPRLGRPAVTLPSPRYRPTRTGCRKPVALLPIADSPRWAHEKGVKFDRR